MGCKNRQRPLPLRINKDAQRVRKPPLHLPLVQRRQPIIIHTRSPQIILTNPTDFMALVQRLTGRSIHAQGRDHSPVDSIHSPRIQGEITGTLEPIKGGGLPSISAENPLPPAKAEVGGSDPTYPQFVCLNPPAAAAASAEYDPQAPSPAGCFSIFSSPRLWSPIPSPGIMFHQILADLPSLSPSIGGN